MESRRYEVTDDSGFLALVDPDAYESFVASDWTMDQLDRHFQRERERGRLVLWRTGREDTWRVDVRFGRSADAGAPTFTERVRASAERLLLTNYESLTMAAQLDDVSLPEDHQRDLLIPVRPGLYDCRVFRRVAGGTADWVVELTPASEGEAEG